MPNSNTAPAYTWFASKVQQTLRTGAQSGQFLFADLHELRAAYQESLKDPVAKAAALAELKNGSHTSILQLVTASPDVFHAVETRAQAEWRAQRADVVQSSPPRRSALASLEEAIITAVNGRFKGGDFQHAQLAAVDRLDRQLPDDLRRLARQEFPMLNQLDAGQLRVRMEVPGLMDHQDAPSQPARRGWFG